MSKKKRDAAGRVESQMQSFTHRHAKKTKRSIWMPDAVLCWGVSVFECVWDARLNSGGGR